MGSSDAVVLAASLMNAHTDTHFFYSFWNISDTLSQQEMLVSSETLCGALLAEILSMLRVVILSSGLCSALCGLSLTTALLVFHQHFFHTKCLARLGEQFRVLSLTWAVRDSFGGMSTRWRLGHQPSHLMLGLHTVTDAHMGPSVWASLPEGHCLCHFRHFLYMLPQVFWIHSVMECSVCSEHLLGSRDFPAPC